MQFILVVFDVWIAIDINLENAFSLLLVLCVAQMTAGKLLVMEGEVRYSIDIADLAKLDLSEHGAWGHGSKHLSFNLNLSNYLRNLAATFILPQR